MARYIIISNLTDEGARTLKKNPGKRWEIAAKSASAMPLIKK